MLILQSDVGQFFLDFFKNTGIAGFFEAGGWKNLIMILIAVLLLYLAIFKKAEPYLLIPMGVGMLLANLPGVDIMKPVYQTIGEAHPELNLTGDAALKTNFEHVTYKGLLGLLYPNGEDVSRITGYEGLLGVLYKGVQYDIYPCLIFLGIGATTDFGPLISNPKTLILGAAAQIGIFLTLMLAVACGFNAQQAASIGIIGGADGPTAILTTKTLSPELLSSIAIAAYSYMALVPFIQPPVIRLLTT